MKKFIAVVVVALVTRKSTRWRLRPIRRASCKATAKPVQ